MTDLLNNYSDEMLLNVQLDKIRNLSIKEEITEMRNPWFVRTFSKMGKGSLRAAIVVLSICGLGPAIYTYHLAYHQIGIFPTLLMTTFVIVSYLFSIDVWIFSYRKYPQSKSLNEIVKNAAGSKIGRIHSMAFLIVCYLSVIAYLLSVNKVFYVLVKNFFFEYFNVEEKNQNFEFYNKYSLWIVALIFFLFCIQNDNQFLQRMSFYTIIIIISAILIIVGETPFMFSYLKQQN